jgi:hypothetical protein
MTSILRVAAVLGATVLAAPALAQTKVAIGISGWTGFAPLCSPRRPASSRRTAST